MFSFHIKLIVGKKSILFLLLILRASKILLNLDEKLLNKIKFIFILSFP